MYRFPLSKNPLPKADNLTCQVFYAVLGNISYFVSRFGEHFDFNLL